MRGGILRSAVAGLCLFSVGLLEQPLQNTEPQEMVKQRLKRKVAKTRQKKKKEDMLKEFSHLNYMNSLLA